MKKLFFLVLTFLISFGALAKIQQAGEESLSDDLNFKLEETTESEREVASDEESDSQSEDSERDVASENEDLSAPIQYWKY